MNTININENSLNISVSNDNNNDIVNLVSNDNNNDIVNLVSNDSNNNGNIKIKEKCNKQDNSKNNKLDKDNKIIHNFDLKANIFTKEELSLDPNKSVFIKFCKIQNDDLIKYYIKTHMPNMYKCCKKSCPTAKNNLWKRKLIYLILHRKNNEKRDCRINNIELVCPNCYCQEYGSQPFEKLKKGISKKCLKCNYPIKAEFANTQNYCYVCNKSIKTISMNYNVTKTMDSSHAQYQESTDKAFEEFMKTNAPKNPDYDLLNDRNKILIHENDEEDIFTELGFDKNTYLKAQETRKLMENINSSSNNYNNSSRLINKTRYNMKKQTYKSELQSLNNTDTKLKHELSDIDLNITISKDIANVLNNI